MNIETNIRTKIKKTINQETNEEKTELSPDWLDKLQNESWQAEILISGGAFVALIFLIVILRAVL